MRLVRVALLMLLLGVFTYLAFTVQHTAAK
jgi:hypothetical protein